MKLKYLFLSVTLILTSVFTNTNIQDSKASLLCNEKWYVSYMETDDMKMPVPEEQKYSMWMIFHKEGKHEVNMNSEVEKGQWEFSKNKDSLHFVTQRGLNKSMRLQKLTKKELEVVFSDSGKEITIHLEKKE